MKGGHAPAQLIDGRQHILLVLPADDREKHVVFVAIGIVLSINLGKVLCQRCHQLVAKLATIEVVDKYEMVDIRCYHMEPLAQVALNT